MLKYLDHLVIAILLLCPPHHVERHETAEVPSCCLRHLRDILPLVTTKLLLTGIKWNTWLNFSGALSPSVCTAGVVKTHPSNAESAWAHARSLPQCDT